MNIPQSLFTFESLFLEDQTGQSISAMASLVCCFRSAVVRICQLWSKEGQTTKRKGVGCPRLIDELFFIRIGCHTKSHIQYAFFFCL